MNFISRIILLIMIMLILPFAMILKLEKSLYGITRIINMVIKGEL